MRAGECRFGEEGLRPLDRVGRIEGATVGKTKRAALTEIGRAVQAVRGAEWAASSQAQRLAAMQRAWQGTRIKP